VVEAMVGDMAVGIAMDVVADLVEKDTKAAGTGAVKNTEAAKAIKAVENLAVRREKHRRVRRRQRPRCSGLMETLVEMLEVLVAVGMVGKDEERKRLHLFAVKYEYACL